MEEKTQMQYDRFGLCPECHAEPFYMNVAKSHFAICPTHKVFWHIGYNLFSSWMEESQQEWDKNVALLKTYKCVEPYYYPRNEEDAERISTVSISKGNIFER